MWFGFGILTLALSFVYGLKVRLESRWSGVSRHLFRGYELQEVRHRGRLALVRLGIPAPAGFHFSVRVEGLHDRFFKLLGICLEIQARDAEFDRNLYIESDARGVAMLLRRRAELRAGLLRLFGCVRAERLRRARLRCAHKRLWLEFLPRKEDQLWPLQQSLVPLLHRLGDALHNHGLAAAELRDPFVRRAAIVLAISTASLLLGAFGALRSTGRTDIIEGGSLLAACLVPGLLATTLFLLLVLTVLGSSSRAHTVLTEVAILGSIGIVLSAYALAREANIDFDRGPARTLDLREFRTEHEVTRGRRGRKYHHYYVHAGDWRPGHSGERLKLEIDRSDFEDLQGASGATVHVRPGALGYEWIEHIERSGW